MISAPAPGCYADAMIEPHSRSRGADARRQDIVEAARAIAAAEGWPAVTVRAVAARIGCSAPAIYQYFRDKDAVLAAMAREGQALMAKAILDAAEQAGGAGRRVRAAARAYWDFALANRELYAVIYGLDGVALGSRDDSHNAVYQAMQGVAAELIGKRGLNLAPADLADRITAQLHGFVAMAAGNRFPGGSERALALMMESIDDLLRGLGRK